MIDLTLSLSDIISLLAFIIAAGSLTWNIVRDFVTEKTALKLSITFGEIGNIKNSTTGLFADAGNLLPEHKFDNPGTLVKIVNIGNRTIGVSSLGGKLKTKKHFSIPVSGLPKMLQPYEIFSVCFSANLDLIKEIHNDEVKNLWVIDTKNKKWFLSRKEWGYLKETADYVFLKKHL